MYIKLNEIEPTEWERVLSEVAPARMIPIDIGRDDWMFAICGLYRKGVIELELRVIPNPRLRKDKLGEITEEDWKGANKKALKIIEGWQGG